jgi:uncharacterized protein
MRKRIIDIDVRGAAGAIESPCVNICRMNEAHGLCIGCWRTLDEIARWSQMDERERASVMAALPRRRLTAGAMQADAPPKTPRR